MSFNNGYERKKFENKQNILKETYQKAGMDDQQISAMYDWDLKTFNSDRRYISHNQSFLPANFDEGGKEDKCALPKKFLQNITVTEDSLSLHSKYGWIEDIEKPGLVEKLKSLPDDYLDILTLYAVEGFKQSEIAKMKSVSQQSISKKINQIKKLLKSI